MSVGAGGTQPLSYRWYTAGGSAVPGGTTSSLTVSPNATIGYYVIVSNDCGEDRSLTAIVTVDTVCIAPTVQSPTATVKIDSSTGVEETLTVVAGGTGPFTYQWYSSEPAGFPYSSIPWGTSATLKVTPVDRVTDYYVKVTNACGNVNSSVFTIETGPPCFSPVIRSHPSSTTIDRASPLRCRSPSIR